MCQPCMERVKGWDEQRCSERSKSMWEMEVGENNAAWLGIKPGFWREWRLEGSAGAIFGRYWEPHWAKGNGEPLKKRENMIYASERTP